MKHIVTLEEDDNGDLVLPLSEEILEQVGWQIGDTIQWIDNNDGTWTMKKIVTLQNGMDNS